MPNSDDEAGTSEVGANIKKIKNATDLQRLKLEKLQRKHADNKEIFIPVKPKDRKLREPLEFIRNIWGSSAGVGSGDFDVYRGIRRREYARQKFILGKADKVDLDNAYLNKVEQNKIDAEQRTAKKREKRQKKKARMKANKKTKIEENVSSDSGSGDNSDDSADNHDGNSLGNAQTAGDCNARFESDEKDSHATGVLDNTVDSVKVTAGGRSDKDKSQDMEPDDNSENG